MVTILLVFLMGITVPLLAAAVAWHVHWRSREEGTTLFTVGANTQGGRWKGKELTVFSGRPADFAEWRFSMDEALAVARVPAYRRSQLCGVVLVRRCTEVVYDSVLR